VRLNLANTRYVERHTTNIHHLIELVHQAAVDEHLGINKTLDWLHSAIQKAKENAADNQSLRLESDEEAVQIITMHRAKGSDAVLPYRAGRQSII
jgi:exodeoxyribonuclease V beta subunit